MSSCSRQWLCVTHSPGRRTTFGGRENAASSWAMSGGRCSLRGGGNAGGTLGCGQYALQGKVSGEGRRVERTACRLVSLARGADVSSRQRPCARRDLQPPVPTLAFQHGQTGHLPRRASEPHPPTARPPRPQEQQLRRRRWQRRRRRRWEWRQRLGVPAAPGQRLKRFAAPHSGPCGEKVVAQGGSKQLRCSLAGFKLRVVLRRVEVDGGWPHPWLRRSSSISSSARE